MIQELKGFPNTSQECAEEGTLVGQNGELFSVLNIDKYKKYYTIEKLALALSRSIRYIGNSKMTVAQHCVRGAEFFILKGDINNAYNFLMHEVSEPFGVSDISTPVKKILGGGLKQIEHYIETELSKIFKFDYPFPPEIKQIDKNLAMDEMTMMKHENPDILVSTEQNNQHMIKIDFDYWNQQKSYLQFMSTYDKIMIYKQYQTKEIIKK